MEKKKKKQSAKMKKKKSKESNVIDKLDGKEEIKTDYL